MESCGAHKAGIAKIRPPDEWIARAQGYQVKFSTEKMCYAFNLSDNKKDTCQRISIEYYLMT